MIRPTVTVSVTATGNGSLHYRWRSSDGQISDVDSPKTHWTLPSGPGVHFAYVLVSDRKGGYTEARVLVSTDDVGGTPEWKAASPRTLSAPAAPATSGVDAFRSYLYIDPGYGPYVPTPGVQVYATDMTTSASYPPVGTVTTGPDGSFVIPNVPYGADITMNCSFDGGASFITGCTTDDYMLTGSAYSDYFGLGAFVPGSIGGHITLADGSPCGVDNDLFGLHRAGTATVLDPSGNTITTAIIDEYGGWAASLPVSSPTPAKVRFRCENASKSYVLGSPGSFIVVPSLTFPAGTGQPTITGMTAPLNGRPGLFLPEPSRSVPAIPPGGMPTTPGQWLAAAPSPSQALFPSDFQPIQNSFLALKGHDTRMGACQYYKAIGAVKGCNSDGTFNGAVSYNDWKRAVKIEKYAQPGAVTAAATYINRTDLNLTRQHESVRYGTDSVAAVVCNHLGPADQNKSTDAFTTPGAGTVVPGGTTADDAVANAIAGKNLVACVAMDYGLQPGVNGNQKFVRFYIFGPSGQLLPSVNLDGRGEKFIPGSCVPCHGGDHYAGGFPEDGSGQANFGGHMLPYDSGNFAFSIADGLTPSQREAAIYGLNQNLLQTDSASLGTPGALSQAGQDLIQGWYKNGTTLDPNYLPDSWKAEAAAEVAAAINGNPAGYTFPGTDAATPFYTHVLARTCRTCHVNQIAGYNFDDQTIVVENPSIPPVVDAGYEFERSICNGASSYAWRGLQMGNSQVTFNRFWLSQGTADSSGSTDMPQLMINYFRNYDSGGYELSGACGPDNSNPTVTPTITPPNLLP